MTETEALVLELKARHADTWQDRGDLFWLRGLLEEVVELALALIRLHRHPVGQELAHIASIAMNWQEKRHREARGE